LSDLGMAASRSSAPASEVSPIALRRARGARLSVVRVSTSLLPVRRRRESVVALARGSRCGSGARSARKRAKRCRRSWNFGFSNAFAV